MKKLLMMAALLPLGGCVTDLVTQTANTMAGGYSDYYLVSDSQAIPYYDSVIFTPLRNLIGQQLPEDSLRATNDGISTALREGKFRMSGTNPIYIDGFVIHADSSLLSKDVVVRVRLVNPQSWQVMREANIVGKAEGVNGMNEAARSIGRGIIKLLDATPGAVVGRNQPSETSNYQPSAVMAPMAAMPAAPVLQPRPQPQQQSNFSLTGPLAGSVSGPFDSGVPAEAPSYESMYGSPAEGAAPKEEDNSIPF